MVMMLWKKEKVGQNKEDGQSGAWRLIDLLEHSGWVSR